MTRRTIQALLLGALLLVLAVPAAAAEGGLVIFSDILENLINGDGSLLEKPWLGREVQLMVLFVLLIFPANRFLFQPLLSVLDQRDQRIAGARARAGQVGGEADEVLARYRAAVEAARKHAESERRERIDAARHRLVEVTGAARAEAESQLGEARTRLGGTLEAARRQLRSQAEDLARDAASRVLGRTLS